MHRSLLDILVDPVSKAPLRLESHPSSRGEHILEGALFGPEGRCYRITNGIPRLDLTEDIDQRQTEESFAFKWQHRNTYDTPQFRAATLEWHIERYGFDNEHEMKAYLGAHRRILDAGCGSGFSASLWLEALKGEWIGMDISMAIDVAQERLGHIAGTHFIQADLLQLPFVEQTFDLVLAEGVLHHTPSTEQALKGLAPMLETGGEFIFYIYRKKGPIREFTDDYVRGILAALPPEQAWNMLMPLTRLGQALAELNVEVKVPEAIPYLGIQAGRYDVQRLVYWHFAKLFWNPTLSVEENNHVNFDWYHPRYAHRQTEDDVRRWCEEADLSIIHFDAQESGFTVRAFKS